MFKITFSDIEQLTDLQLTEVLKCLLYAEASRHQLYSSIHVSLKVDVPDGGEDGRIEWIGGPNFIMPFLRGRKMLFQCKATTMPPSKCKDEILIASGELKPRIAAILEDPEGHYVLFHSIALNKQQIDERMAQFRAALRSAKKPYAETAKIHIYEANIIAQWVNQSLSALYLIFSYQGKLKPLGMKPWDFWSTNLQLNRFKYVKSSANASAIARIRRDFLGSSNQIRIVGLSGLGKTRLAKETFQPQGLNAQEDNILAMNTMYIDMQDISAEPLIQAIAAWVEEEKFGILIIDNCMYSLHQRLVREISYPRSRLKLLTLNFEPSQDEGQSLIRLYPEKDSVIQEILTQEYPQAAPANLERIVCFAQGFPQMAMLLAEAHVEDLMPDISQIPDSELVKRLLWGRGTPNNAMKEIISVCALFNEFGWTGSVANQYKVIARIVDRITVSERMVQQWISDFTIRGLIIEHGEYLMVSPKPLALHLAADWLIRQPGDVVLRIINEMPEDMLQQFALQFSLLDFLPKAREIARVLCDTLFDQPEIMQTTHGAFLVRHLVDVDPAKASATLKKLFSSVSEINQEVISHLAFALEKLAFRQNTFHGACLLFLELMSKISLSAREGIKTRFLQLFQIQHSGTETPVDKKLDILIALCNAPVSEGHLVLMIEALGRAITVEQLPRQIGAEFQGSGKALVEWSPKEMDLSNIQLYRKTALTKLLEIAKTLGSLGKLACKIILDKLTDIINLQLLVYASSELVEILRVHSVELPETLSPIGLEKLFLGQPELYSAADQLMLKRIFEQCSERLRAVGAHTVSPSSIFSSAPGDGVSKQNVEKDKTQGEPPAKRPKPE